MSLHLPFALSQSKGNGFNAFHPWFDKHHERSVQLLMGHDTSAHDFVDCIGIRTRIKLERFRPLLWSQAVG